MLDLVSSTYAKAAAHVVAAFLLASVREFVRRTGLDLRVTRLRGVEDASVCTRDVKWLKNRF